MNISSKTLYKILVNHTQSYIGWKGIKLSVSADDIIFYTIPIYKKAT